MYLRHLRLLLATALALVPAVTAFAPASRATTRGAFALDAKRKKAAAAKDKGFGASKAVEAKVVTAAPAETLADVASSSAATPPSSSSFLQSVEGGSAATPVQEESLLTPEERAKFLLREKYGMKSMEEQQMDVKQAEQVKAQRMRIAELKKKAANNEEIDFISMVPAPLLRGMDLFLKAGVVVSGLAFIAAGIGITAEAWSKASDQPLPEDIDNFIVNLVEPNFTPGLLVVLAFSVSLGVLSALQLSSGGATYKEE